MYSYTCAEYIKLIRNYSLGVLAKSSLQSFKPVNLTILDATCAIGRNLALFFKQSSLVNEIRLYDYNNNTHNLATDLNFINTRNQVQGYDRNELGEAIRDAHIVVSVGGCQTKNNESYEDLFEHNVESVKAAALHLSEFNPNALFCIAKPPIEALVPMASEEYKRGYSYDHRKIIGIPTQYCMAANSIIAQHTSHPKENIMCPIIGGCGRNSAVAILSQTSPIVNTTTDTFKQLQDHISGYEDRLLTEHCNDKSRDFPCLSKVTSISRFLNSLIKAIMGDPSITEYAFIRQTNHIGEFLPYMTSIVRFDREGVRSSHMPKIDEQEAARLKAAVPIITENILLGECYINGDYSAYQRFKTKKRQCDCMVRKRLEEYNRAKL